MPNPETNEQLQTVLIVDDNAGARDTLVALLTPMKLNLPTASGGQEAIDECLRLQPDLLLLDLMMSGMDGFQVCRHLRGDPRTAMIPIVVVTALDDRQARLQAIEAGADEFLTKPFDRTELRARVRTILRLNRFRRQIDQGKQIVQNLEGSVEVLQDMLSLVDTDAFGQSKKLKEMATGLGEALNYSPLWELRMAAALCRVGRVIVPPQVREKASRGVRLSPEENRLMTRVPEIGARLLGHIPAFTEVAEIVLWQDKRFDGTGFPYEIRVGKDIHEGARILHVLRGIAELEEGGLGRLAAITACEEEIGQCDPDIIAEAKKLFGSVLRVDRLVMLGGLEVNMVTRSPIKDEAGRTLVAAGMIITEALKQRLLYFHEITGLQQPFEVSVDEKD